jgi:hypothetical protein
MTVSYRYSANGAHDIIHLPCPARPCQRCVKRGIAGTCTEGHRKKAKYLLDDDELGASLDVISAAQLI